MLAPSSEVRGKRKRDKRVSERQPGTDPGARGRERGGAGVFQPACTPGGRVRRTWGRRKALLLRRLGGRRAQLCSDQGRRHVTKEERRPNLLSFFFFFSPKLNGLADSPPTPVVDRGGRGCGGRADVSVLGGVSQGCCWAEVHRFLGRPAVAQCQCVPQSD